MKLIANFNVGVFEDFLNLVIPTQCIICRALGSPICSSCQVFHFSEQRSVSRLNLRGVAVCEYSNEIATLIHEFKENSQTGITRAMAQSMAKHLPQDCLVLVPMPSKVSAFAKRGFNPAKLLAVAVVREIAKSQNRLVQVCDVLSLTRDVSDQAALDGHHRRNNLAGAMGLKSQPTMGSVWLVDDIVTTGATLQEAARCLGESGVKVGGFLAFAETLPKNRQKAHAKSF